MKFLLKIGTLSKTFTLKSSANMLVRIVKMSFEPEHLASFLVHFERHKEQIRNFPGCQFLEVWQEEASPNVIFSHSHWVSAEALEAYRKSEFFRGVWDYTKRLFKDKPEAWTVKVLHRLP
jgi:quinol monooxygenase YgiN